MPGQLISIFIKFRDFLVTFAPWLLLALAFSAALVEVAKSRGGRAPRADLMGFLLAGAAAAAPSLFGTLQFDYRLAALRGALLAVGLVASFGAQRGQAGREAAVMNWTLRAEGGEASAEGRRPGFAGLLDQARSIWAAAGPRFDRVALWFGASCVVSGLLAIYLPYDVGFNLFGRTAWVGVALGLLLGHALKRGTGMDLPLASLLVLKGAAPGAVAALLLASNPLPFHPWRAQRWGLAVTLGSLMAAGALAAVLGPALL